LNKCIYILTDVLTNVLTNVLTTVLTDVLTTALLNMLVSKRNGMTEPMMFDKITARLASLCWNLPMVDPVRITQMTASGLVNGIQTEYIDMISADNAENMCVENHQYGKLSARIRVSNLHKNTPDSFSECMMKLQSSNIENIKADPTPCLAEGYDTKPKYRFGVPYMRFINENSAVLDAMINHKLDYKFGNHSIRTVMDGYLHKILVGDKLVIHDRPQYMFMRVAIALNVANSDLTGLTSANTSDTAHILAEIKNCYDKLSTKQVMHATPTLFNACANTQQLLSCFLFGVHDSIEGIMDAQKRASIISKYAGGLGLHMHQIRCSESYIYGTGGKSTGLIPQAVMWEKLARTWNQGGKRKGSIAIYLEPTHGDIMSFLQLKMPSGLDSERARDLHIAMWLPDLFMQKYQNDPESSWCLFSGNEAKNLSVVYDGMPTEMYYRVAQSQMCSDGSCGNCANCDQSSVTTIDAYSMLYERYENKGLYVQKIPIKDVMNAIITSQRETGEPYICYKDHVNRKSNHKYVGTIQSSNLCTEIMEYSDSKSYACCTLMSLVLSKYVNKEALGPTDEFGLYSLDPATCVDYRKLHDNTRLCVRNLNKVINVNSYSVKNCEDNNKSLLPIAIGIQGLADLFCKLRIPFCSDIARIIDLRIMETIYHAALTETNALAQELGSFDGFKESPMGRGILQPDMWRDNVQTMWPCDYSELFSGMYDWEEMRARIRGGARNSLLVSPMPTVSTSQITGNNESFEPFHSNLYLKSTLAGRLPMVNKHLMKHLISLGIWNTKLKDLILENQGSVQGLIPEQIQEIYKTIWEIPQRELIKRAAIRGAFVDQSQSLNIHLDDNSNRVLKSVMRLTWQYGLKTGSYYIRTNPAVNARRNKTQTELLRATPSVDAAKDKIQIDDVEACPIGCTSCSG